MVPPWGLRGGAKTTKIHEIIKNLLLYSRTSSRQTIGMNVMSIESSTKIVKFVAPGSGVLVLGRGSIDYTVKMHYFFENNLLCSWVFNKQIKHIVIMSKSL
jgi:hypothetical protein